jgi:RimJ/RimL family protein N-acetyltransferase
LTPTLCARGARVALGPLRRDLLLTFVRWGNDLPASRNLGAWGVATEDNNLAWLASHDDPARADLREFLVYGLAGWRPLGVTTLHQIDRRNGTAELAFAIGERDARGRGFGTEAARLTLAHAFNDLGLRTILLRYYSFNPASGRVAQKLGFREIGRQREALAVADSRWDMVYTELLARDFAAAAGAAA